MSVKTPVRDHLIIAGTYESTSSEMLAVDWEVYGAIMQWAVTLTPPVVFPTDVVVFAGSLSPIRHWAMFPDFETIAELLNRWEKEFSYEGETSVDNFSTILARARRYIVDTESLYEAFH